MLRGRDIIKLIDDLSQIVINIVFTATLVAAQTNLRPHGMDLLRLLSYKPWISWAQTPRDRLQRANIQPQQDTNLGNQDNDDPVIENDDIR